MKPNRTQLRHLITSPVGVVAMVVIVVAGFAGVAAASGGLGAGETVVRARASVPSTAEVGVAGPVDAQMLPVATPSPSPTSAAPAVVVPPLHAPRIMPAKSSAVPPSGPAAPAPASNLGDAQFHNVTFSCPPSPVSLGVGPTVLNCTVASLAGFSGQITTRCSPTEDRADFPGLSPMLPLTTVDPGFSTCSVPAVDLAAGGSAVVPVTITMLPTAPLYSGTAIFLTLYAGGISLNPGRPYSITGIRPPKPANFTLACRVVTQTALPMPLISAIIGSCTVTALDAADIAPTSVHTYPNSIKPPVSGNQFLQVCMASTEAAAIPPYSSGCPSNAVVTPTGGTGTVWFGYSVSPAGSTGAGPGPWEFDFASDQGGTQVKGSATFTLQPDRNVAGL